MKITDLLNPAGIDLNAHVRTKEEAIDHLVALMDSTGVLADAAGYKSGLLKRETEGSTAVGEGVAIPHARARRSNNRGLPLWWSRRAAITILLTANPAASSLPSPPRIRRTMSIWMCWGAWSALLMDDGFRQGLLSAKSKEEFLSLVDQAENGREEKEEVRADGRYRLLGVTACPTGIAHTYMAAEGLLDKAKELGITMKVETDGSGGVKNALTAQEIAQCDAVIVAADREVEMSRFDGKPVLRTKVSDGINKPGELIEAALNGKAPIYHAEARKQESMGSGEVKESAGRKIYKYLMNGSFPYAAICHRRRYSHRPGFPV